MIFLSYILNQSAPTYGNRNRFELIQKSSISKGDIANDSFISTTTHIGTHIDMPYHFYDNGQTIEDFDSKFWVFNKPLIIEIEPKGLIIKDELIDKLNSIKYSDYDVLIVKTGICDKREQKIFWSENYGFHPDVYDFLIDRLPKLRVFGFDSISISSFTDRLLGREAHKRFLNPKHPILLLEDMDLRCIDKSIKLNKLIISPLRIAKCDGLPCTVIGFFDD